MNSRHLITPSGSGTFCMSLSGGGTYLVTTQTVLDYSAHDMEGLSGSCTSQRILFLKAVVSNCRKKQDLALFNILDYGAPTASTTHMACIRGAPASIGSIAEEQERGDKVPNYSDFYTKPLSPTFGMGDG